MHIITYGYPGTYFHTRVETKPDPYPGTRDSPNKYTVKQLTTCTLT